MAKGVKDFIAAAKEKVDEVQPAFAHRAASDQSAVILDVREPGELSTDGVLGVDHHHIPRGILETKADPESGAAHEGLTEARDNCAVLVVCASGGRAAMAAERLAEMGYDAKVVSGGFKAWREAGLPTRTKNED